jgi:hypothetical protein
MSVYPEGLVNFNGWLIPAVHAGSVAVGGIMLECDVMIARNYGPNIQREMNVTYIQ